ncbi:ATP/GTP-binding protein [Nitrosomonas sp. Nm166]|uniref:AAA family ATPase n=1 Tax=Nitrosomonas sp. Nm166 TaxID=1881054 RepID=UPI0008E3BE1E|nr:AAA family ATPase [Nitrosomonas sp. Nm166]SFF12936.1 ATPase/GTPase, AAA15 family [Nitrosomonas sp. Nm166]
MIEKIEIKNYRCFESLTLNGLGRINIIVGPNSSGKTALMEAIFLASGINPELALRIKKFRGLETRSISQNKVSYEELWKDLFYDFDQTKTIEISINGSLPEFCRNLSIAYQRDKPLILELSGKDLSKDNITSALVPIRFKWNFPLGKSSISAEPEIRQDSIEIKLSLSIAEPNVAISLDELSLPTSFYTSANVIPPEEHAHYFSQLSIHNKEHIIVEALKSEFPFISGLSVEIWSGAPAIFASVEGINEKIPLNLVSSGVNKLIGILLGIAIQEGGVICIDEIENGFYFDRLPSIWELLFEFSTKFNVQIFASTHSWECLQAASDCASNSVRASDFRLIQALNDKPGFKVHSGEALIEAMIQQIDVR